MTRSKKSGLNIYGTVLLFASLLCPAAMAAADWEQGTWQTITYDTGNIQSQCRILVSWSEYAIANHTLYVHVVWKVQNLTLVPKKYGWKNKYLLTYDNLVAPANGTESKVIEPFGYSEELWVEYAMPIEFEHYENKERYSSMSWGLKVKTSHYVELNYAIKLFPKYKNTPGNKYIH